MSGVRIGIDLGGTKIEAATLDARGRMLARERVPTPANDYDATLDAICALVRRMAGRFGAASVGVAIPGSPSPASGLIRNANSQCLNGRPLQADLEARLGRPVRLANDANCFALSEAVDGAAAGARSVFGVIIGTGTGGGLVVNGELVPGAGGIAGEWGHNPLPWMTPEEFPGPACWCGQYGCIETYLSGPGLARDYAAASGVECTGAEVARRAAQGDAQAEAALERYESRLARGLAAIINVFDPEVIVLGGGLSQLERLYSRVPALWGQWVFSDRVASRLVPPRHGDSSGVRGAAWLWSSAARVEA
ncbi:ROK family protein [Ectothiorhodospiraceae bacterium 2226]|nr:ROK family protein [Ectothiorhodospiraceae bacterium 2226]